MLKLLLSYIGIIERTKHEVQLKKAFRFGVYSYFFPVAISWTSYLKLIMEVSTEWSQVSTVVPFYQHFPFIPTNGFYHLSDSVSPNTKSWSVAFLIKFAHKIKCVF